jgi:hypothetical protein
LKWAGYQVARVYPDGGAAGDPPPEEGIVKRDASPFPTCPDGVKIDASPFPSELFRAGVTE